MSKELTKNIGELNGAVKSYVQTKIDLLKLSLLEKATRFTSYLFSFVIITMFVILIIGFAAAAFAIWYGQAYQDYVGGVLIAGGALIVVALVFILLRNKIVTNSVIRNFSDVLFDEEEKQH